MFIRKRSRGYYRGSEQCSGKGEYLALFSWNHYKALEELQAKCVNCQCAKRAQDWNRTHVHNPTPDRLAFVQDWRAEAHRAFNAPIACLEHRSYARVANTYHNGAQKLWAIVRKASLRQCGHWMMGSIRVGGKSITVSGAVGSDGLPSNYQDCPEAYRHLLVEVPADIAKVYWADHGHNDVGSAAGRTLQKWALETFKGRTTK